MNKHDNGGPAFPCMPPQDTGTGSAAGYPYPDGGMTLRDYFAAKAMQAWVSTFTASRHPAENGGLDDVARVSYQVADAMLKARDAQ